jgi:hypothetical protein
MKELLQPSDRCAVLLHEVVAIRNARSKSLVTAVAAAVCTPFLLTGCIVPSPSPGPNAVLRGVAAVNTSNAWAVGHLQDSTGQHELMEHWNGKNWQEVFLPPPIGTDLFAITAVNASNIWAVGDQRTLHFDGVGWRSIANPARTGMYDVASGLDAAVYGLGESLPVSGIPPDDQPLPDDTLLVMTAKGWRSVSAIPKTVSPVECDISKDAEDLAITAANDVWIVGSGTIGNTLTTCTTALHWNGSTCRSSAMPAALGLPRLFGVSSRSTNDVWAVGEVIKTDPSAGHVDNSLVMHWNGATWSVVPSPDSRGEGYLKDVDATAAGVWAVGTAMKSPTSSESMLIKKWTGTSMADQPAEGFPVVGLVGVTVGDGVVTSVGWYEPRNGVIATLTDRRNAS